MTIFKQREASSELDGAFSVVVRQRGANISTEHVKAAFGEHVIIIDTDHDVHNGIEYLGVFHDETKAVAAGR